MPSNTKWKTAISGVRNAILPPNTTRPNPLVAGDRVFAAIFAPGAVCAVTRQSGKILWKTNLDAYAGSAVILHNRILYAASCRTLYALGPETGKARWQFTPQSQPGEWIYSQPVVGGGCVFIGDRKGYFHCLDAATGEALWRRQTSRACNNQVNATALIVGQHVITANNDGAVVCYDVETGATVWRQRLDGGCIAQILRIGSEVIVPATFLYALDVRTGGLRLKLSFPQKSISSLTSAGRRIVAVLGPDFRNKESPWTSELVIVERGRALFRRNLTGSTALRTCAETGFVYAVSIDRCLVNIIDSSDGSFVISRRRCMSLPDTSGGFMYGLTRQGLLFAEPALVPRPIM